MALFKVFRGLSTELNAVAKTDGHAYFCTDDGSFWIDYKDSNSELQRKQVNDFRFDALEEGVNQVNIDLETLEETLREEINTREIVAGEEDDRVVILVGTDGTNAVSYRAEHAKVFGEGNTYTSANTVTEIKGNGDEKTIKIPQITVDQYGHVTDAQDKDVKITLPSQFEITANATDDDVVVLTGTSGFNGVTYDAKHAKVLGEGKSYTSGNTTTSIDGSEGAGATGKIKIPQFSVNAYGHVTAANDEEVEIKIPSIPTEFDIDADGTGDEVITVVGQGGANSVYYTVTHSQEGANTAKGPSQGEVAIANDVTKVIQVPKVTVDKFGHVTALEEHGFSVTIPTTPEVLPNPAPLTIGYQTYDGSTAITVTASDLGLVGALTFLGITETEVTDGSTNKAVVINGKIVNAEKGNVVIYKKVIEDEVNCVTHTYVNKEFLWNGTSWEELGDESSYAYKTVQIIAGNGLTGGGTIEQNRTLNVGQGAGITVTADAVAHADTSSQASITANGRKYITGVTLDTFGHVTGLTTGTETVVDTNTTYDFEATKSSANGAAYLKLIGSNNSEDKVLVKGTGATTVTTDANGNVIINSPLLPTNHVTTDTEQIITGTKNFNGLAVFKNNNFEIRANTVTDDSWIKLSSSDSAEYYAFGIRRPYDSFGLQMKYHNASGADSYYDIYNSDNYTKIPAVNTTANGLMSAEDKKKLDTISYYAGNITFEYKDGVLTITEG